MKHLVIFFDGTSFRSDGERMSNVSRLLTATERCSTSGITQMLFYHHGVGSGSGSVATSRFLDRALGGAFATGLGDIIERAYREVVLNYEPGDRLFLFGWSRGAFAARRLVDVLRAVGLPDLSELRHVRRLVRTVLTTDISPGEFPDTEKYLNLRRDFSRSVATSEVDLDYRRRHGQPDATLLDIAYIGLWDCVAAIGLPLGLNAVAQVNAHLEGRDRLLSRMVQSAWHAVALDERSLLFPSYLFENFEALNAYNSTPEPYQQKWFPGGHASVGGASPHREIGDASLQWIADGARRAGLEFDHALLDLPQRDPVSFEAASSLSGGLFGFRPLMRKRPWPKDTTSIMPQIRDLMAKDARYHAEQRHHLDS